MQKTPPRHFPPRDRLDGSATQPPPPNMTNARLMAIPVWAVHHAVALLKYLAVVVLQRLFASSATEPSALRERRNEKSAPKLAHGEQVVHPAALDLYGCAPISVPEQKMVDGKVFPLALGPSDASAATGDDLVDLVRHQRDAFLDLARKHHSVLFRGWGPCTAEHYAAVGAMLGQAKCDMACSAGPRVEIARHQPTDTVVFTNEAPPTEVIPFHHEMAQCDNPPAFVLFFCLVEPPQGGATPIVPSHPIATYLRQHHSAVASKLKDLGVRYVRVLPYETDPSSALGKSWRHSLRVANVEEAEAKLRGDGATWEWLDGKCAEGGEGGGVISSTAAAAADAAATADGAHGVGPMLRTVTKAVPALLDDEIGGREVFFTAAESTFNRLEPGEVDEQIAVDAMGWETHPETGRRYLRPIKAIIYGDGTPLDAATKTALREASQVMEEHRVAFRWRQSDALLLDNASVMHARETFTPPRKILACLAGQLEKVDGKMRPRSSAAAPARCYPPLATKEFLSLRPKTEDVVVIDPHAGGEQSAGSASTAAKGLFGMDFAVSPSSTMDELPKKDPPAFVL